MIRASHHLTLSCQWMLQNAYSDCSDCQNSLVSKALSHFMFCFCSTASLALVALFSDVHVLTMFLNRFRRSLAVQLCLLNLRLYCHCFVTLSEPIVRIKLYVIGRSNTYFAVHLWGKIVHFIPNLKHKSFFMPLFLPAPVKSPPSPFLNFASL